MIDYFTEILKFIDVHLIKGLFISVIIIILSKLISKNKINTNIAKDILKYIIITHALVMIIYTLVLLIFPQPGIGPVNRLTGPYWYAYYILYSSNAVLPLSLLNKKLANNLYIILMISVLINIGWIIESFAMHLADSRSGYLPYKSEISIFVNQLIIGVLLLVVGNIINKRNNWKVEK